MSSVTKIKDNINLKSPEYYPADDSRIESKKTIPMRVFYSVLPFIALHKPFGRGITLIVDTSRSVYSLGQLISNKNSKELIKTAITILALIGTIFAHPMGLFISTLSDLGYDISQMINLLLKNQGEKALLTILSMFQHSLYLGTLMTGSLEIVIVSLFINMIFELSRSKNEFSKGNFIETASHLLMSMVRFTQAASFMEKMADKDKIYGKEFITTLNKSINKARNIASIYLYSSARFFITLQWKITDSWIKTINFFKDIKTSSSKKVISTVKTVFSTSFLPFAITGLVIAQILHFTAFLLAPNEFINLKGEATLKEMEEKFSVFQNNSCFTSGGFSTLFGGTLLPNEKRAKMLSAMIKENNPDLVCLQEVSDLKDAYTLYNELKKDFADFYLNIGAAPFILQNNSGLFVASKVAIEKAKFHSFSDIYGIESMVNKGFFIFTTKLANFVTTHLSPSKDDLNPKKSEIKTRDLEQEKILSILIEREERNKKNGFVLGDFNINWNSSEYKKSPLFSKGLDNYNLNRLIVLDSDATAETDFLINSNWHHKKNEKPQRLILDYFLSLARFNKYISMQTRKLPTFDIKNPKNAISDHAALISEINF